MKTFSTVRGFVKPAVLVIVILTVVILGYYLWANDGTGDSTAVTGGNTPEAVQVAQFPTDESPGSGPIDSSIPAITEADIEQGWYYGDANQKKPGTPSSWLHRNAGTRSAQWYDPSR